MADFRYSLRDVGVAKDGRIDLRVRMSRDNGKTWDYGYDVYVNGIDGDLGYPSTVELSDGSLLTVFYAHPSKEEPAIIMQQKWSFEND